MAGETTQQGSGGDQTNNQSSSQSTGQGQSTNATAQDGASQQTQTSQDTTTGKTEKPTRPEWVPESFFDPEKGVKGTELRQKFDELSTRVAADDSRKASLPATPEAYELKLPETFKAPEGIAVALDANDPLYKEARTLAHAKGWTQGDFSDALGIVAQMRAGEAAKYEALKTQNLAALGAKGPERIDAVTRWLNANGAPEEVKPIIATLATSGHVTFFEKIISKLTSQGSGSFRRGGEDVDTGKVDDATWDKMSYSQKKEYTAKHNKAA